MADLTLAYELLNQAMIEFENQGYVGWGFLANPGQANVTTFHSRGCKNEDIPGNTRTALDFIHDCTDTEDVVIHEKKLILDS